MQAADAVFYPRERALSNPLLDQLPSYQSLLYKRRSSFMIYGTLMNRPEPKISDFGRKWAEKAVWNSAQNRVAREMPLSMHEKRQYKLRQQNWRLAASSQWKVSSRHYLKTLWEEGMLFLRRLQFWKSDIHLIEGMFGTGVLSYFSFLRFLVLLNFIMFLLMFSFVILPIIVSTHTSLANFTSTRTSVSECSLYPSTSRQILVMYHQRIIDFLSGTGFLEHTYLFYGYYNVESVDFFLLRYNLPLAYVLCTIVYLLLSLLWIVKRSAAGFKRKLIEDEYRFQSFCNKIFAGWDFCITSETAVFIKHYSLLNELKSDLEEERIRQKIAERSRQERCHIYLIRFALNMFVTTILFTCFCTIYSVTIFSLKTQVSQQNNFILKLIIEYLPSIVITLANFITPTIFSIIINYEDYSPAFEIRFTLLRCVFMRLASIGVLLFSLWSHITSCNGKPCPCGYNHQLYPCWETHVGQEMYKLMIFDFLIIGAITIFIEFPRKIMVKHCKCGLMMWLGHQEFSIPQNVLQLVYGQTICWIGTFYCPLLPAINTIKCFLLFYIKKTSLVYNCRPTTRPFRASSSTFFFLAMLLIGLTVATLPVTVSLSHIRSSGVCGPFTHYNKSWDVVPEAVSHLPTGLQSLIFALTSEAFAVPFFVITCLVMFFIIALVRAHKRVINQLRDQLAVDGRDKRFLMEKLCQAQSSSSTNLLS